jgi:hydrogenase maturation protease
MREKGTLILGIGNPILSDDGVGIQIARKLKEARPGLEIEETNEAPIVLLDYLVGYDKLIVVDSIQTGHGRPGELYKLKLEDLKTAADGTSSHGIDIATAFEVGRNLGCKMPGAVNIYAVEVMDNENFSERCTAEVEKEIPSIVTRIIREEKL